MPVAQSAFLTNPVPIKNVNSDRHFGKNTYELTNIVQAAPGADPFQIPPGYTVKIQYGIGSIGTDRLH